MIESKKTNDSAKAEGISPKLKLKIQKEKSKNGKSAGKGKKGRESAQVAPINALFTLGSLVGKRSAVKVLHAREGRNKKKKIFLPSLQIALPLAEL